MPFELSAQHQQPDQRHYSLYYIATEKVAEQDPAGNAVSYGYDADGRDTLLSVDGDDRVVQQVAGPLGSTPTLTTSTGYDPDGTTISQIVTSTSPIAATRSYTAAVNAADWTSSSGDQPTAGTPPLVTAYSYDAAGQQRGQTILNSASTPVTTTLDAEGRITAIGEGLATSSPYTTTYSYNPNDLPVSSTLPNGVQVGLGYDPDSRLTTLTGIGPTGVVTPLNNSYSYAYNPDSWTTAITSMVGGITATNIITHDALGRMVAGNASGRAQSWRYDGNGNLLSTNTVTYSYTAAITPNEVLTTTTTSGVTTTYSYDQNGDTTGISSTAGVSTNLSYDSQARLDAVKLADGTHILLTYNAQGQRVGYSVSKNGVTSESEQVTYRGDELAQAVISNTQRYTDTYLYDPSGAPLELIRQTKSGSMLSTARYWYVLNGHGDVVALTDVNGNVVDSYSYDLWGKLGSAVESVPQRLRYAGYWYDQELGWYWVAVRSYNPTLMRWLQPDPSQQDGVRTYVYVGDDPVDQTDPTGQGPGASPAQMCHLDKRYCSNAHQNAPNWVVVAQCAYSGAPYSSAYVAAGGWPICGAAWAGFGTVTEDLQPSGYIDPFLVRFTQDSASWHFDANRTVGDLVKGLRNGSIKPEDVPPIKIVLRNGQLWSLDNRRLEAFRRAGIPIRYRVVGWSRHVAREWIRKFTTRNNGESIRLRGEPEEPSDLIEPVDPIEPIAPVDPVV